ncbi:MAG: hypothetical protein HFI75_04770 [Lachnospiraceae bacterium]|nr:hypothetical protein [Lachnospiraceae bacterium]
MGTIFQDDSVFAARTVFKNCGVAFPEGNCTDVLSTLMSNDYVGWRMCTIEEAQMCANEGKAALGISEEQVVIVKPEEEKVLVKSTFVNPKARSGFAGTIDVMKNKRESEMQFFAYSAAGTTTYPSIYATVCTVTTCKLTEYQMSSNARYIFNYLRLFGFTKQAACGVLGNMQVESYRMDPGIWEVLNNTKHGYGLVQWTPATKFIDWAAECKIIAKSTAESVNSLTYHYPEKLMDAELDFLIFNTTNKEFFPPSNSSDVEPTIKTFAQYKASTLSPKVLAKVFHDYFERSNDLTSISKRMEYADHWYSIF